MADLSIGARLVEQALKAYDYLNDRKTLPTNRRIFLESTLDNNRNDITERDFNNQELRGLAELITNKYRKVQPELQLYRQYIDKQLARNADAIKNKDKGKMIYPEFLNAFSRDAAAIDALKQGKVTADLASLLNKKTRDYYTNYGFKEAFQGNNPDLDVRPNIQYEDYQDANSGRVVSGNVTPQQSLSTTLGRFNYSIGKDGSINVKDAYDFNPATNVITNTSVNKKVNPDMVAGGFIDFGPSALYNELRAYAGEKIPQGQGRNVNITLTPQNLQELFLQEQ